MESYSLSQVEDHVLLRDLAALVSQDRATTASLLAHIAEVDERRPFASAGFPSMHAYCVGMLRMSEDAAAKRIHAARAARKVPAIFAMLADGRLSLSVVCLLAPHLTRDAAAELLAGATHKTRNQVELLLAERFPRPDLVARWEPADAPFVAPATAPAAPPAVAAHDGPKSPAHVDASSCQHAPGHVAPSLTLESAKPVGPVCPRARITPLSPGLFMLEVLLAQATHDKLRRARELLGHAVPSGDVAQVLDRALDELIERFEKRKFGTGGRPRPATSPRDGTQGGSANRRRIPAAVRRDVSRRDGGRCTFVAGNGNRCESRTRLELDHIVPVACGGEATTANLRLRCRTHNQHAAEQAFGAGFMRRKRAEAGRGAAKRQAAARAADAEKARRETRARELAGDAAAQARALEVIPWLRTLGAG